MSTPNWVTESGLIGVFPASIPMTLQLVATPINVTYKLISGSLPSGLSFRIDGLISGTPSIVSTSVTSTFVVRATEPISGEIKDRTFSIKITGQAVPTFTTPSGSLAVTYDSIWQEIPIEYNNPIASNPVYIRVVQGLLPPGLEINEYGLIRGYPLPPITLRNYEAVYTIAVSTYSLTNYITLLSTYDVEPGRSIIFTGTVFGGIESGKIYYVKRVIDVTNIQITEIPGGEVVELTSSTGSMNVELPATQIGSPASRMYSFTLQLISPLGNDNASYSITVKNYYLPASQGGPSPENPPDTRPPTLFNTRPPTYKIDVDTDNYGYYVLPPDSEVSVPGMTYPPTENAYIGQFVNDDYMAFKIIGNNFDTNDVTISGTELIYNYINLPIWLTGNTTTGWIYGTPNVVPINDIEEFDFQVSVSRNTNTVLVASINDSSTLPIQVMSTDGFFNSGSIVIDSEMISYTSITANSFVGITRGVNGTTAAIHTLGATITPDNYITSDVFNFSFQVANNINGVVTWVTESDLGSLNNASNCYKHVEAISDVSLVYEIVSGALPPNLTLTSNGEIQGIVAYQPTDTYKESNTTETFTFTVRAYSNDVPLVSSEKTFTLTINQYFDSPTDNLYIKCTPSINDREILRTLLDNNTLIPANYIYRSTDPNFGKASSVIYTHAYGVYASTLAQYIEAVKKNHYWRNITLGEIKTAVAKDENGDVVYEVVYSNVIDNLQKYNPNYDYDYRYSVSISEEIFWPRYIDLHLGPWYTSETDIYTSFIFDRGMQLITNFRQYDILAQTNPVLLTQQGSPTFYTSLTPGYARILYPNSLENMRKRVSQELGADYNYRLLPLWMSCQQNDGNTLGFTPAWVICYTKPVAIFEVSAIATEGTTNLITVTSKAGLELNGTLTFHENGFGGIVPDVKYYIVYIDESTNRIKISVSKNGEPLILTNSTGDIVGTFDPVSYAEIIKNNIVNNWNNTLNTINFQIDRFTVDKQITYNFDSYLDPEVWTRYPSATPVPDPIDSENFYVLFPQKTILPTTTQYDL